MRLHFISPFVLLTATYFSCYVNTLDATSYLEVHVYSNSGDLSGAKTEIWSTSKENAALVATQKTDSGGLTTFELPAGTSEVRVHFSSTPDYVSEVVSLKGGETKRVEFFDSTTHDP
jgi:hypothetical protein